MRFRRITDRAGFDDFPHYRRGYEFDGLPVEGGTVYDKAAGVFHARDCVETIIRDTKERE